MGDGGNASAAATVAAGLEAGCDMDCGSFYTDYGEDAVAQGLLSAATIDRALGRIFTMRLRLAEFDPPGDVPYNKLGAADVDTPAHRDSALRAAREAIVLLNNSAGVLPLAAGAVKKLACVGILANATRQNGGAPMGGSEMGGKNDYNPAFTIRFPTPRPPIH